MFLERKLFAVLDDYSETKDTITICRRNPRKADGTFLGENEYGEVEFYPHEAAHAGNTIRGIASAYSPFSMIIWMPIRCEGGMRQESLGVGRI